MFGINCKKLQDLEEVKIKTNLSCKGSSGRLTKKLQQVRPMKVDTSGVGKKCQIADVETSDGQIQIIIWFKSWLNHWWWFDLSTKYLI